jgi:DNA-binding NarL/FixJ family response regulator
MLEATESIVVVGEASDGFELVRLAREHAPDVVILDVAMPGLNGIETARQLTEERPGTAIVMLSMHSDRQYVIEALRAGASGYVLKDAAFSELLTAVRAVSTGRTYLTPAVSQIALDDYVKRMRNESAPTELERLSSRERQVLQLIAEGKTSAEIGRALFISAHTVETHRRNIMEKLELHNVVDLVKFAIRHGLASAG